MRASDVVCLSYAGDLPDGGCHVGGFADLGLDEDVSLDHLGLRVISVVATLSQRSRPGAHGLLRGKGAAITIEELGEFGLIDAITRAMARASGITPASVAIGPGDDAAVLHANGMVVATTDMMIEGRHFRADWSSAADIGHKAAARNLADVAAMGATPAALLVAFAGPGKLEVSWVTDLAAGIASEGAAAGASVAGGDTSSSDKVMIAITALGELAGRTPVRRSGARPGDVIAVAGRLGSAAAGYALLAAGMSAAAPGAGLTGQAATMAPGPAVPEPSVRDAAGAGPAVPEAAVRDAALSVLADAHRRPQPPYQAGPEAALLGATSMIDVSDGLIADLGHVSEASGVRIELRSSHLRSAPVADEESLRRAAEVLGSTDWLLWVLTGGDDHALVATFPAQVALPQSWTVVGTVAPGHGVAVDGRTWTDQGGWEHFRP
ncbi:MAG TPA: thiamine-phosphate kinase [Streptosporangiaceae bacterium]|nr:thiamine-phosphate kinase [Streptosporangiaceae bacterium]